MVVGFSIEHGIAVGLADGMHRKWSSWAYFCLLFTRFAFSFPSRCCYGLHRRGISRSLVQNYSGCQGARGCIPGSFFLRHRFILSRRTPNFVSVPPRFSTSQFAASLQLRVIKHSAENFGSVLFSGRLQLHRFLFFLNNNCHFCCFFQCRSRIGFVALFEARFANVAVFSCGGILRRCNILGQLFLSISRTSYLVPLKVEVHSIFEARFDFNLVFALLFFFSELFRLRKFVRKTQSLRCRRLLGWKSDCGEHQQRLLFD